MRHTTLTHIQDDIANLSLVPDTTQQSKALMLNCQKLEAFSRQWLTLTITFLLNGIYILIILCQWGKNVFVYG